MLNLSIMPLDTEHVDEVCADIVDQQRRGISTHAMMIMYFTPEGTPPRDRAAEYCEKYDLFRARLDREGAKYGVLVQSTLGHISKPASPHPFQTVVSLVDGSTLESTCCPLDSGFRKYIKGQMRTLATHHPSVVMIDDDVGLVYRDVRGCACPLHLAQVSRRAGKPLSREEIYAHTQGDSEEDRRITAIYIDVQRDALVGAVRAMREGLDEVDPTIQGVTSGIYTTTFCEFSGDIAEAFAGKGNPRVVRMNNGMYTAAGARNFTKNMFRAAILRENIKDKVDVFLAETDTCPQNRYSTSASLLHAHFTGTILEGAKGAKHWITRLVGYDPKAGRAYRQKLATYAKFYEALTKYADELSPVGCRIPLTLAQDYGFVPSAAGLNLSPWSTCVLERLGLPLYFSASAGGAVFLDDISVSRFDDATVKEFFGGTLFLSAGAADALCRRGFSDLVGVRTEEWQGKVMSRERYLGRTFTKQVNAKQLIPTANGVEVLSEVIHKADADSSEVLFPAVTGFENPMGGYTVTFCGTPDTPFHYATAFSMLCEARKAQLIDILRRRGDLPVWYPEDAEVYLRAGYLKDGTLFCAFFNIGLDPLEDIPLCVGAPVARVQMLNTDGLRVDVPHFYDADGVLRVNVPAGILSPVILFLS